MKTNFSAIVFAVAIITASYLLSYAVINRDKAASNIQVTGLGNVNFTSDLIVWEGSFDENDNSLKNAYALLAKDKKIIKEYLIKQGVAEDEIVFKAVNTRNNNKAIYNDQGRYTGEEFLGYILSQGVKIESHDVEKIEKVSREITELLNKGVQFYSYEPRYYYTKLADLKIEMISKATEDAHNRALKIAENSGSELGDLVSAKMGVFQITGQNSNEDYSWGGTFNTSDKRKTASITMKLQYKVD
ncbi:MAG: DUF541 domain-containing protein [Bacteroidales bacterium]|nr:DUF541 domain-containing protein [Bacteroidales bacterium]